MESQEIQNQAMGYDRAATMFSPDGHILQVEYAEKTVRLGSASIGFACSDGVVILADKRANDSLMVAESANKIFEVDSHIIGSAAGILSDARVLVERAQLISQQHRVTYDTPIDTITIIKDISDIKQQFTQHPGVRPFGISMMIAGVNGKSQLFVSDVTGNFFEYYASAIGENDDKIKEALRAGFKKDMKTEDALKLGLQIFKEVKGKNFNVENFDAAVINNKDKKVKRLNGEALKKYIK
ncbi:archaeal proteasome endopeptidase complex subunit alpha [Candidatus Pacearchaeota archaeon]|nr:archaeal proteasome endopeptidase complex subunit alpha [Candidatus Pacearchaeota archaeon]